MATERHLNRRCWKGRESGNRGIRNHLPHLLRSDPHFSEEKGAVSAGALPPACDRPPPPPRPSPPPDLPRPVQALWAADAAPLALYHLRGGVVPGAAEGMPEEAGPSVLVLQAIYRHRHHHYYSSFAFGPITSYWKFVKKLCTYELLGARNLLHFQPLRTLEVNSFLQILMRKGTTALI